MNLWIINRLGEISNMMEVHDYDIAVDYLTSEKTNFRLSPDVEMNFSKGDFVMGKNKDGIDFFGVMDSYENNNLICNGLNVLVNFQFPATTTSGPSFEQHARNLINKYLILDNTKKMEILDINVVTNTPHVYQPVDPPTPTNLMQYIINGFKKYNIVWEFDGFIDGRVKTSIRALTETIQFKDNIDDFIRWDVSTTEVGKDVENHIMIVDKNTKYSEYPIILAEYWLMTDNEVTDDRYSPKIELPSRTVVNIYDDTIEDKLTYKETAEAAIKGSYYAHEISVEAHRDNKIVPISNFKIGMLVTLVRKGKEYSSVISGIRSDSSSSFIEVRMGHIRSRLSELLD